MPSIFSRSRTTSTPKAGLTAGALDEFGRINSRGSPVPGSTKKDKKKEKDAKDKARSRTISTAADAQDQPEFVIPDGSFLPLNLDPPNTSSSGESALLTPSVPLSPSQSSTQSGSQSQTPKPVDYGYLSYSRHVVLGLEEVARLVDVVGDELGQRGLTTPFIFSTLALDVSSTAVRRLIAAFLRTCNQPGPEAVRQWREEAKFANPHELGMCLRWGLARVVRIVRGNEVRGLISYESYAEWRDQEIGQ